MFDVYQTVALLFNPKTPPLYNNLSQVPIEKSNNSEKMQIFIKLLSGVRQGWNFESDDTVSQVKQTLQEREGIMVDQFKLICGGRQLADENTLAQYKIEAGSVIHMVMQLRGG